MKKKDFDNEYLGIFSTDPAFDLARSEANAELIQILAQYLTDHPSERFGQALLNLGVVRERSDDTCGELVWCNEFYVESTEILKRVEERLKESQTS